MKTAILILCHETPHYWIAQAKANSQCNFYIHYDLRSNIADLTESAQLPNVHILQQRSLIHWAGYSMIEATLNLMHEAIKDPENSYFHLVSGSCVALHPLTNIHRQCQNLPENSLFLNKQNIPRLRYRLRFNTPHANTTWQRSIVGKLLTKYYQLLDFILPSTQQTPSGSQWFSANRTAIQKLLKAADSQTQQFFRHKLCPDEHFFQYLLEKLPENTLQHHNNNRRFIVFSGKKNHPETLELQQLQTLYEKSESWFARKVQTNDALTLFQNKK